MIAKVTSGLGWRCYEDKTGKVLAIVCGIALSFGTVMTIENHIVHGQSIDLHAQLVVLGLLAALLVPLMVLGLILIKKTTIDATKGVVTLVRGVRGNVSVSEILFSDITGLKQSWVTGRNVVGKGSSYSVRLETRVQTKPKWIYVFNELGDREGCEKEIQILAEMIGKPII